MSYNPLRALRYLHTIHAAPECERLRHIYQHVFGGLVFHESYYPPEDRDAALLYVADHMIEVMSPRDPGNMDFMYARYVRKSGPSWHSISFRVADCAAARAHCEANGIKLNTTGPGLIFLHPKSTGGIIMELTDHPWFIGVQFHPELKSKPFAPHPLFADFIRAAKEAERLV